ncbi:MAG: glycoside hydrolase family 20 zincin-like fold domain-containing protein, partial [Maribacter sp.]
MANSKSILCLRVLYFFTFLLFFACSDKQEITWVYSSSTAPQVNFALQDLEAAIGGNYMASEPLEKDKSNIVLLVEPLNSLHKEGFSIKKDKDQIIVTGFDEAGLMYGTLELAEQLN